MNSLQQLTRCSELLNRSSELFNRSSELLNRSSELPEGICYADWSFLRFQDFLKMLNTNESVLMENSGSHQDTQRVLQPFNPFLHELPGEMLYQAFKQSHPQDDPLEELIATGNAAFTFISEMELTMEKETRDAFYRLEKQFNFYGQLLEMRNGKQL